MYRTSYAINHDNKDEIMDAIGDIYVTIRGVSKVLDIPFVECVDKAYNEIKGRRGTVSKGGTFMKDLPNHPSAVVGLTEEGTY